MPWRRIKAAIGLAEGGALRQALDRLKHSIGLSDCLGPRDARSGVAFTIAIVALTAKLSKADGVSTSIEADAFAQVYQVPEAETANVRRLYDLAKQDATGFQTYARQIATALADEPELRRDVLEGLFHVATADGLLHDAEDALLAEVTEIFGLTPQDYRRIRSMFVADASDPYLVLGVAHDAPLDEIKRRHRVLVKESHPDRLMAHGVPREFLEQATRKLAAINAAYDAIVEERRG